MFWHFFLTHSTLYLEAAPHQASLTETPLMNIFGFATFCSDFVKRGEPQKLEALQKDLSEQRDSVPWGAKLRLQNQSENYVTFWCFWL